jgi:hypothetical protein
MSLEKVISNQVVTLLDKHNILNNSKFGFGKCKPTKDTTASITDNFIENINNKVISLSVLDSSYPT